MQSINPDPCARDCLSVDGFFVVGYLAVALAILAKIAFLSEFFIGTIFLGGSIFVWLGNLLQHRMIAMIQVRYVQAHQATDRLELEHSKLEAANTQLNTEVDERRRVEAALRESEQRFKLILDQRPTGILIIDETTKIIKDANSVALKTIGRPLNDVIGAETDDVRQAIRMGAGRYVKKPNSLKAIGIAIKKEIGN